MFETDAKGRIKTWKNGIRGKKSDSIYSEVSIMERMGWSWKELCETPETVYLATIRILNLKSKEQIKKQMESQTEQQKAVGKI